MSEGDLTSTSPFITAISTVRYIIAADEPVGTAAISTELLLTVHLSTCRQDGKNNADYITQINYFPNTL